ncbi:MAG: tetratricopeptide repeat protein [Betaproteobacteria bacterium]|nr:tetratricopeptide repeat protein [Betaproteobacteria bacterium]
MPHNYRFGQVEIRPAERRILVDGQPVSVGARAFDLLLALIARRERVVSKDELLELVWPGLVVEENNLQVQVSTLRKLLGAHALATIPGRGYRFTLKLDGDTGESLSPAQALRMHNLPAQLNSFVGREREISELTELLGTTRLVTLTSMGGTGKTRLSLQVAAEVTEDYPDGVWFVELAPLGDERLVPQAVASVLGVKEVAGRPVLEALERFVRDRQLLLILDNCEHLVQACADLAKKLLRSGRGLQILASSREHLHVMGETTYPVPSLAVPDPLPGAGNAPTGAIQLDAFMQYGAVRLFMDRAVAAQPAFKMTRQNVTAIADICRRLDGIPLAIELAAARVSALSVDKIATRLSDRFGLLTGGDKTSMPRQQTLRASIDWSYDLLLEPERILLQRLSVFAGGWTLDAAEAVGAGDSIEESAVLDILIHLVEKSLVVMDATGERYRLLETVRQYALGRLHESGGESAARMRHFRFYSDLAERARPALAGPEQGKWLARLDLERENLLSAHAWADRAEMGATLGLSLVWALRPYWITRGFLGLGQQMTVEAISRPGAEQRNLARCRGLFDAGQFDIVLGRYAEAQRYLEESLAIAREIDDKRRIAVALQPLGMACMGQGDMIAARIHLQEALAMASELGNKREIAGALNMLAQMLRVGGELDTAEPLYEKSLALARELEDRESIAIGLLNLAMVSIDRGSADVAAPMLLEALAIAHEIGSRRMGQSVLEVSAGLAALRTEWALAAQYYGAAEALAADTGLRRDPADEAFLAPRIARTRQAMTDVDFATAETTGRAFDYEEAMGKAHGFLAANA